VAAPFLTLEKAYARAAKSISRKTVVVASDISSTAAVTLAATAVAGGQVGTVTITSDSTVRKLARTDSGNDSVIKVNGGAKVVFQNITIDGKTTGSNRALAVSGAGTEVTLETGAKLTGKLSSGGGGGANVTGGKLTMKTGAQISESISASNGGAVSLTGTFTMDGGELRGNSVTNGSGGGIYIGSPGVFTMNGGVIAGNTHGGTGAGGGVYAGGGSTFYMYGGTIYGSNSGANSNTGANADSAAYAITSTTNLSPTKSNDTITKP
jgi:hypothetical protein